MASGVKLSFSDKELDYIQQSELLITKRIITEKLYAVLGELQFELQQAPLPANFRFPDGLHLNEAKISKGENYRGLPYVILDHPRLFNRHDVFAYRTLFWWGNFISCTLHLQGQYLHQYLPQLSRNHGLLSDNGFFVSVGDEPWEHHFEVDNYRLLAELGMDERAWHEFLKQRSFVRLSRNIPLEEIGRLKPFAVETWTLLLRALQ